MLPIEAGLPRAGKCCAWRNTIYLIGLKNLDGCIRTFNTKTQKWKKIEYKKSEGGNDDPKLPTHQVTIVSLAGCIQSQTSSFIKLDSLYRYSFLERNFVCVSHKAERKKEAEQGGRERQWREYLR